MVISMKEEVPPHQDPLTAIKELAENILKKVEEMIGAGSPADAGTPADRKERAQHIKEYAEELLGKANELTAWVRRAGWLRRQTEDK